ncbi:MAG: M48 family metallopeptidase [Myxococcota bacterium]
MKSHLIRLATLVALAGFIVSCATSPTGRRQFLLNDETQMSAMGAAAFQEIRQGSTRSTNSGQTAYVRCVASAIISGLTAEDMRSVSVAQWEVELFQDESANAFALPGGKIGVHTGLLNVATNQDQLATVLGHEVGHVLARHSNERASQEMGAQTIMQAGAVFLGAGTPAQQQMMGILGAGVQYGILMPYGRTQESESDEIGLLLMARAGFDPRQSIPLWQNMGASSGGQAPPEFMSTHPSHATRIAQLQGWLSDAMPLYQQAQAAGRRPNCR